MSAYQSQVVSGTHRLLPYQQTLAPQSAMMVGRHRHSSVVQYAHPQPLVQTDQLKAMLKRKIKGPQQQPDCKPLKVPKLETLEGTEMWQGKKQGINGYSEKVMGSMIPSQYRQQGHYPLPSSFQFVPPSSQNVQVMQVMQPEVYAFGAKSGVGLSLKGSMPTLDNTESTTALMSSEQVVPDVNVPDSFLTPEPSPISSPQLSTSVAIKVEDQHTDVKKGSFNILQALEKLAAMPHQIQSQRTLQDEEKMSATINNEPSTQGLVTQRKRELPIFDAFDIDNFFDALDPPAGISKGSVKMEEDQVKKEVDADALNTLHGSMDSIVDQGTIKCEVLSPPSSVSSMSPVHRVAALASPSHGYNYQEQQQIQPKSELPSSSSCMQDSPKFGSAQPSVHAVSTGTPAGRKMEVIHEMSPIHGVSSCPPAALCRKRESLDDLLSYFSDEGADLSPFHSRDMPHLAREPSASSSDDLLDEDHFHQNQQQPHKSPFSNSSSLIVGESFQVMTPKYLSPSHHGFEELSPLSLDDSHALMSPEQQHFHKERSSQQLPGELSPSSSSSSLAGEDEVMEGRTAFTFDLALKMLDMQEQDAELLQDGSLLIKNREVMNIPDELGFILDSLVPSESECVSYVRWSKLFKSF